MKEYHHLTMEERVLIAQLKQSGTPVSQIALKIGRDKSTISRELRRNQTPPGEYWPDTANALSRERRKRGCILDNHADLREFVVDKLCSHHWTPEQIAADLRKQPELPNASYETIYAWIYSKKQHKSKLWKHLPRHKSKRGLRKSKGNGGSKILHRVSIHERPEVVNSNKEFGHWEVDLMSFKKNTQYMLVMRERKTMYTISAPLKNKKADTVVASMTSLMRKIPKIAVKTFTYDNGTEFANHHKVNNNLKTKSYFCDSYASWQKGGVENTNGRLRRDFPRNTDIHKMAKDDFDENIENYNTTPRKKLGWNTPLEAFVDNLNRVALAA